MFCPSCGAPNNERDQRYCRECGATLPVMDAAPKAVARRPTGVDLPAASGPTGRSSSLVTAGMKHRGVQGAIAVVVLVVAVYALVHIILATLTALILPIVLVLVAGALGYFWLKGSRRR